MDHGELNWRLLRLGFMSAGLLVCVFTLGGLTGYWFATRYRLQKREQQRGAADDADD